MKQLFFIIAIFCCAFISVHAQTGFAPKKINYQGVARNAQGQPLANQNIKIRASLQIQGPADDSPTTFYSEVRNQTTNQLGLFSFQLNGSGRTSYTGTVYNTGWLNPDNTFYLKMELDVNNSGTYTDMGTQQIVSVPYAWYSERAREAEHFAYETPVFQANSTTGQTLTYNSAATTIIFENVEQDNKNSYSSATGEYTALSYAPYSINAQVKIAHAGTPAANEAFRIYIKVNNVVKASTLVHTEKETTGSITALLHLVPGNKVKIDVQPVNGTNSITAGAGGSTFSCVMIR